VEGLHQGGHEMDLACKKGKLPEAYSTRTRIH
jgi:hypothetical protein